MLGCVPVIVGLRLSCVGRPSLGSHAFLNEKIAEKIASRGSAPHPARAHALDPLFTTAAVSGSPFGSETAQRGACMPLCQEQIRPLVVRVSCVHARHRALTNLGRL